MTLLPARMTAALLLPAALAAGADLGVPRDGYDRVLLDDGRVVDARALPREGDLVPLEFPAGTIRVPRARVVEVRPWRDFDPAPRDDAEKAKTAQGFVRWKGVLVPPDRAEALRAEEVAKEREAREAAGRLEDVDRVRKVTAGPFRVRCNGPAEDAKYWCSILAELGKQVSAVMPRVEYPPTIGVTLEGAAPLEPEALRPRILKSRNGTEVRESDDSALIGVRGLAREEGVPHLLFALAPRLVDTYLFWDVINSAGWARHGLAEYFSFAELEDGKLRFGVVADPLLLRYREMEAREGAADLTALLRSGNRYVNEEVEKRKATGEWRSLSERDSFDPRLAPSAWMLVHYLMEGEGGKHRKAFLGWFRCVADFDDKVGRENSRTFESSRDFLLRQLKVRDLDTLAGGMRKHAAALEYRQPATWLSLAGEALAKRKDAEEARACAERGVFRAAGRARDLLGLGSFLASLPGGEVRAREVLEAAVAADPLDGNARGALSLLLPPGEAEPMRALALALGGTVPSTAVPPK